MHEDLCREIGIKAVWNGSLDGDRGRHLIGYRTSRHRPSVGQIQGELMADSGIYRSVVITLPSLGIVFV